MSEVDVITLNETVPMFSVSTFTEFPSIISSLNSSGAYPSSFSSLKTFEQFLVSGTLLSVINESMISVESTWITPEPDLSSTI